MTKLLKILFLLLIGLNSIDTFSQSEIEGEYRYDCNLFHARLKLKENNAFEFYEYSQGLQQFWTKTQGTWKIKDSIINLNSIVDNEFEKKYKYEVVESLKRNNDSITIKIINTKGEPIYSVLCELKMNGKVITQNDTNKKGILKFPKAESNEVTTNYPPLQVEYSYRNISHKISPRYNYYVFTLKKDAGYYSTNFKNEKLICKNNKIIFEKSKKTGNKKNKCDMYFYLK